MTLKAHGNVDPQDEAAMRRNLRRLAQLANRWADVDGYTGTITFYAASSSGGAVTVLNTVTIVDGLITNWTQA